MSNELATIGNLTPQTWQMIGDIAPVLHRSRLFGVASPEQAVAIMLKGHELGIAPSASFELISVIQGRPTLSPRGALALVMQSGQLAGMKVDDQTDEKGAPTGCTVWMKRVNGMEYTATWTMQDARRAGVVKPDSGWANYPANMLRWRAIGFVLDVLFTDITGGMRRSDEFGAPIDGEGNVVKGEWAVVDVPRQDTQYPVAAPAPALSDLVERYGAEAVMAANNGLIPGTDDEVRAVAAKLVQS